MILPRRGQTSIWLLAGSVLSGAGPTAAAVTVSEIDARVAAAVNLRMDEAQLNAFDEQATDGSAWSIAAAAELVEDDGARRSIRSWSSYALAWAHDGILTLQTSTGVHATADTDHEVASGSAHQRLETNAPSRLLLELGQTPMRLVYDAHVRRDIPNPSNTNSRVLLTVTNLTTDKVLLDEPWILEPSPAAGNLRLDGSPGDEIEVLVRANSSMYFAPWELETSTESHTSLTFVPLDMVGDMNLDGVVDTGDVGPFVLALTNPSSYMSQQGVDEATMLSLGDVNGDGVFDTGDVAPFVQLLVGGNTGAQTASVPEPGVAVVMVVGLMVAGMRRRGRRVGVEV